MKIAVEGCAHGELDRIYDSIKHIERKDKIKIDLLICCGDFQATRNTQDLNTMAVPPKYRQMCSFYKYYSGEKVAPILTIFIGGNHEASNHLQELPYGGWAAPNIYYLGTSNIVKFGGIRIGGISGIYKGRDYHRGRYEIFPYTEDTKRSVYHTRNLDIFRLKQVKTPIDIFLSHDWPRGIYKYGNTKHLLKMKPFFLDDIQENKLGSPPLEDLLHIMKPSYWFSAHLHCKFVAIVHHKEDESKKETKFLALDKCLPKRKFLQILDIPHDSNIPTELSYDLEWLTVLHYTNHLISVKRIENYMPGPGLDERYDFTPQEKEKELILQKMEGNLKIPLNFCQTVPPHEGNVTPLMSPQKVTPNPQTEELCLKLGITDPLSLLSQHWETPKKDLSETSLSDYSKLSYISDSDASPARFSFSDTSSPSLQDISKDFTPSPKTRTSLGSILPPPKFICPDESNESIRDTSLSSLDISMGKIPRFPIFPESSNATSACLTP